MPLIVLVLCGLAWPVFLVGQSPTEQSFHPQIPRRGMTPKSRPTSFRSHMASGSVHVGCGVLQPFGSYQSIDHPIYRPDREPADYLKSLQSA